jgi:hypothetical protein
METNSYFVNILENSKGKFIRRKKRKGIKPYARTLSLKLINKILMDSNILYPKMIKNRFNYIDEEDIVSTNDVNSISRDIIFNYFIDTIKKLNFIDVSKYKRKISWNNNSEFIMFQINNFLKALKLKKINNLENVKEELNKIDTNMDDNRKLCFIHGDLHLNNILINNKDFYLIDWELATIGDLAYELAIHFILMNYSEQEETIFIDRLSNDIICDKKKLIHDINEYKKYELIRRKTLHGDVKNHFH